MNQTSVLRAVFISVLALTSASVAAETRHVPTLDEGLGLRLIGSPRISPDGRYVAYSVRETNWEDNEFVRQLWLVNVSTGRTIQLTRGKKSARGAEWSPDGRWLAFTTEREAAAVALTAEGRDEQKDGETEGDSAGKPVARQIWLISPEGGEAWQLTRSGTEIGDYRWSRDSTRLAFTASAPESSASRDRKQRYSDYEVFERDFRQDQLWLVDVSEAEKNGRPVAATRLVADSSLNVTSFRWSPDSTQIAFAATPNPLLAFRQNEDIFLLDLSRSNAVKQVVALPGPDSEPVFSPDGKQLAFGTALGQPYDYYANGHIATVDLAEVLARPATTPADLRDLTAGFDEDASPLDWGPDGIDFGARQRTSAHAFRLDPHTGKVWRLTGPDDLLVEEVSFTADFKTIAFTTEDPTHMTELFVSLVSPFAPRKLTDLTAQVKDWTLGSVEVVSWKSQDGTRIEGVLHKPADYDPARRYPLLVLIHGGPTGTALPTLSPDEYAYPVQKLLAKGALVLEPNYRGSAGYGAAFRALNVRNLGVGDMWDVMSGVDELVRRGIVDPERLGAMGWSQGGYISAFLATHTDRFKAISAGAGISDWMTYYVSTDITPFTRQYLHATPWDDPEVYARTSPITTIKQAKTPVLIQSGSEDKRVPVPNSFELYRGLRDQGVESRLQLFTGFGHGVNKPKSLRALQQSNLDWFSHYLWGEPIPSDSPLHGTSELDTGR